MEQQILEELQSINELLTAVALMIFIGTIVWVLKNMVAIYKFGRKIKSDSWRDLADHLYSKGDYTELLKQSKKRLEKEPKGADHLYWKAKAEKELNDIESLRESVSQLVVVAPSWKEEWMDEYLVEKDAS